MTENIILIEGLSKEFKINNNNLCILKEIDFKISKGDIVSISGPSGSGKSTLLNIIGLLDSNFDGSYKFLDYTVQTLAMNQKNKIRNSKNIRW